MNWNADCEPDIIAHRYVTNALVAEWVQISLHRLVESFHKREDASYAHSLGMNVQQLCMAAMFSCALY